MYFDLIINDVFGLILNSHMVVWSRIYTAQSTAPRHSTYFSFEQENQERNCKRITTTKITAKKINGQGKKNVATAAIAKQQKNSNHTHLSYSVRISVCVYMHINIHLTTKIWNKNGIKIRIIFSLWLLSCVFFSGTYSVCFSLSSFMCLALIFLLLCAGDFSSNSRWTEHFCIQQKRAANTKWYLPHTNTNIHKDDKDSIELKITTKKDLQQKRHQVLKALLKHFMRIPWHWLCMN